MDKSAFQLFKNNPRSNANTRLHETPFISYGRVIKVIDIQTVVVETIVQTSLSKEVYTVTLINLSSALLEISDYPKLGDTVLLLFLQRYDPRMFVQPTVNNPNATGYNRFSGVGVLMSTARHFANTVLSFYEESGKPIAELTSNAEAYAAFNNLTTITFCRAVFDSDDEALVTILFGKGRPLIQKFLSRIERSHGFWWDNEDGWEEMDASITEEYSRYAPIARDIQGAQTTSVGLGKDKHGDAGKPVETEAPIAETVHGKAPITRDIRSPQTTIVGIGNAESEDAEEERDAPVNETYGSKSPITKDIRGPQTYKVGIGKDGDTEAPVAVELGGKADVTLTSKSGLTVKFKKAVLVESEDAYDLVITGPITFHSDGKIVVEAGANAVVKAGGKVYIGNSVMDAHTLLKGMTAEIKSLKTFGQPGMHTVDPASILSLTLYEQKIDALFTPGG
jgi:hypothetical protein